MGKQGTVFAPGILLWLLACLPFEAFTQEFTKIQSLDGLPGNVTCLMQDSKGFMWIGTDNGLCRYDGVEYKIFRSLLYDTTGLADDVIASICEDSAGNIWIGSWKGGLASLNRRTGKITHHKLRTSNPQAGTEWIIALYTDTKKRVWIWTGGGLFSYDAKANSFLQYAFNARKADFDWLADDQMCSIFEDHSGRITVQALSSLFYVDEQKKLLNEIPFYEKGRKLKVYNLYKEERGYLGLVGTDDDKFICRVDPSLQTITERICKFTHWVLTAAIARDKSSYYIGSTSGLFVLNSMTKSIEPLTIHNDTTSLNSSFTRHMIMDKTGLLWADWNVLQKSESYFHTAILPGKSAFNNKRIILTLYVSPSGRLYAGAREGGVFLWDSVHKKFDLLLTIGIKSPVLPPFVSAFLEDSKGNLWMGTLNNGPAFFLKKGTSKPVLVFDNEESKEDAGQSWCTLHEDRDGIIWAGTWYNVIVRYDPSTNNVKQYKYPIDSSRGIVTNSFAEDKEGIFWIGTSYGVFTFDRKREKFKHYKYNPADSGSISSDQITDLAIDSLGRIWVGTRSRGLNYFEKETGTFRHFIESDGLPSNRIGSILAGKNGTVWITTAKGLSHLDPATRVFTNYDKSDGFNILSGYCRETLHNGDLFWGSGSRVQYFSPDSIMNKPTNFPIVITSFKIADREKYNELFNRDTVSLPYFENDISFSFIALDLRNPNKKWYAYMIEGIDDDWVHVGNKTFAAYSNIEPGNYTLRIRASNTFGMWEKEIAVTLIITPPFWGTWWFRSGIGLLAVSGIGFLFFRRERRRKQYLSDLEAAREKERLDLASELHDGPLQDLYATRFMIEPIASRADANAQKLDELLGKVRSDLRIITSELQIPRFDLGFAEELRLYLDSFSEKYPGFSMRLEIENEASALSPRVMQNLFRIFRTALANIPKHAEATKIAIRFYADHRIVHLSIADNGKGFVLPADVNQYVRERHFGLFTMQNFAEAIGFYCSIETTPGKGTTITVSGKEE